VRSPLPCSVQFRVAVQIAASHFALVGSWQDSWDSIISPVGIGKCGFASVRFLSARCDRDLATTKLAGATAPSTALKIELLVD
jgi:hypothetical protein